MKLARPFLAVLILVLAVALLVAGWMAVPASAEGPPPARNSITAYGNAIERSSAGGLDLARPLVGMTAPSDGRGYWGVASDGGVFAFGDVAFLGSMGGKRLNQPIVGMAASADGGGYWLVASDGGVFAFGSARFHGSTGSMRLNRPIVDMAATPDGNGYWLVASDGGVFTFGSARFHGSAGSLALNSPVTGAVASSSGRGYWLVASDGGIFTYGDARFYGSMGGDSIPAPVTSIASARDGSGYWLAGEDGQVYPFGTADYGNAANADGELRPPVVGIAAVSPTGYWLVHGERLRATFEDKGPHVERLQRRLADLGYWVGPVDGVYGELTKQAVYAFEKTNNRPVDGNVDRDDRFVLDQATRPTGRTTAGTLIEVDKTRQVVLFVRDGRTEWVFNTSTGTEEPYTYKDQQYLADTPPGRWTVSREVDGWRESNLGRLYRPKYFHPDGIAVHGYTFVPPYPASHGCVRVTLAAMDFIWDNGLAPIGGDVWVYGTSPRD